MRSFLRLCRAAAIACVLCAIVASASPALTADDAARACIDWFGPRYQALEIPGFDLDWTQNFKHISTLSAIERRLQFLAEARTRLAAIPRAGLSDETRYLFECVNWVVAFQWRRATLEKGWRHGTPPAHLPAEGLHALPDGPQWYALYLDAMGMDLEARGLPQTLIPFGQQALDHAVREIRALQKLMGYEGRDADFSRYIHGPKFYLTDAVRIEQTFRDLRASVAARLFDDFEKQPLTLPNIAPWPRATRDSAPGYYDKGTFYYTFYGHRFPRSAFDFLFLHEALPGHAWQAQVADRAQLPTWRGAYACSGFIEGWGAYAETLGADLGCYRDPVQALGRWQWDVARCARVILDVRVNADGWSRERALAWWRANVPFEDDIAEREVDRVIRWPAQSQSYKVGAAAIERLRELARAHDGERFDLRRFHTVVLRHGAVPLAVLDEIVTNAVAKGETMRR